MSSQWDNYGRQGIDLASAATSIGFAAAKTGTKLGFYITRKLATATVGAAGLIVDHAVFGGSTVTSPVLGGAVSSAISLVEQITLAPIYLGEYITSTSLLAAHSSINVLSVIFPGSSEASFSLASFITLVKREWNDPLDGDHLPNKRYGLTQVARAIVAWVALQGVTQEWQERRWFKSLSEIHVEDPPKQSDSIRIRKGSRVRVTSDVIFPGNLGQIISADIGEAPVRAQSVFANQFASLGRSTLAMKRTRIQMEPHHLSNKELKATLRRLSKMVLAGYGGASLLFFGVSPDASGTVWKPSSKSKYPIRAEKDAEEAQLAHAIQASEAEAAGESPDVPAETQYSWWDVLLGRHDQEIFERFANMPVDKARAEIVHVEKKAKEIRATAVIGVEHLMPRFWVLTDHSRGQIVLVLRGTMSLNEIAVDLTCEPEEFEPASSFAEAEEESSLPGQYHFPGTSTHRHRQSFSSISSHQYQVHGGMLRMAKAMGDVGKPVQLAVQEALHRNPDYELITCGHSLGAGVAALLGLMWADPKTCLTVRSSGLPVGRRVSVYCFAPPCLTDKHLSKLASKLVVSFVYSHDVVSRLGIGSIRDLKNAAMWLCDANEPMNGTVGEGYATLTKRARQWKAGSGSVDDPDWFIAVRKTLEANMQKANLYPPGRVLWAMRDSDLHPSHRLPAEKSSSGIRKLRLFEVLNCEVFSQIVFARDMLSAHLPHQYDQVLHDLL